MRRALFLLLAACGAAPSEPVAVSIASAPATSAPVPSAAAAVAVAASSSTCSVADPTHQVWDDAILATLPAPAAYASRVKPGNQTAIGTAAEPFAKYLVSVHNAIHPIFADGFIGTLEKRPKDDPLSDVNLVTRVEIVLDDSGAIESLGVVKSSGQTRFDAAVLASIRCAAPFGAPPAPIVSADGKVYVHWEFHRDGVFACTTMHARPFLLMR